MSARSCASAKPSHQVESAAASSPPGAFLQFAGSVEAAADTVVLRGTLTHPARTTKREAISNLEAFTLTVSRDGPSEVLTLAVPRNSRSEVFMLAILRIGRVRPRRVLTGVERERL